MGNVFAVVVVMVMVVVVAKYIQSLQDERVRLETLINGAVTHGGKCCWCCCCCCDGGGGGGHVHTESAGQESQTGDPHQWYRDTR